MLFTDEEIIKKLNIRPTDRVLDIGGSMMQHAKIKVDTIVDLIRPEEAPYKASRLTAKNFVKLDIRRERLPFKDKDFDICLCTHTLEDLPTPFLAIEEMQRVAKRGLIVTPSMGQDMVFGPIDYTDWLTGAKRVPGLGHHKWFFVKDGQKLKIIPKVYAVLYTPDFQIIKWRGEPEMVFFWEKGFGYEEVNELNIHKLIDEYKRFIKANRKNIDFGLVFITLDNLFNLAKALAKKLLKRGVGYSQRKVF